MRFSHGDIVEFDGRKGHVVGVVASGRMITRGRHAGIYTYKVAPLGQRGSYYEVLDLILKASNIKPSKEAIAAALGEQASVSRGRRDQKASKDGRQREQLEALGIQGGERILVRCAQGNWMATVKRVNPVNGRVCIMSPGSRYGERWINSSVIIKVVHEERPAPVKMSERIMDDLQDQGWAQVRYGREFIERSYVVAFTPDLALEGNTYECASKTVNFDPELKLYWRDTGIFD
jgi:hypothetical protein